MKKRSFTAMVSGDIHSLCTALGFLYKDGGAKYTLEAARSDRFMISDGYDDRILISPEGFFFYTNSPVRFQLLSSKHHKDALELLQHLDFETESIDNILETRSTMPDNLWYTLPQLPITGEYRKRWEEAGYTIETRELPYFKGIVDEPLYKKAEKA